ncbi:MAG: serine phosphatase RsbU (regulator of sigma subunit)/HAMP domain-containing protein [bacterium]|jgi:serine phosphatase RsbU (regulator of sigma subunit)/HAMP domain-containing protein
MNLGTTVRANDSIAKQLLTAVFSIYFIVAVTVTLIHMSVDYMNAKEKIIDNLRGFQETFQESLSGAIWNMDESQVNALLLGILKIPTIVGAKILDQDDSELLAGAGTYIDSQGKIILKPQILGKVIRKAPQTKAKLFSYRFPVMYREPGGRKVQVGFVTFYSSTDIVFAQVKVSFSFIIINSVIKTIALWIIFLTFSRKLLGIPLSALTEATRNLDLKNLDNCQISIKTKGENELKLLEIAFNGMIQKLLLSKERLISFQKVHEKLLKLDDRQQIIKFIFYEIWSNTHVDDAAVYFDWNGEHFHSLETIQGAESNLRKLPDQNLITKLFSDDQNVCVFNRVDSSHFISQFYHYYYSNEVPTGSFLFAYWRERNTLISLYRSKKDAIFDASDVAYVESLLKEVHFAQQSLTTIQKNSRMEGEFKAVMAVQCSFLPKTNPTISGFDIASTFSPANEVSGDYYDFIEISPNETAFIIADVSGKGISAAMYGNVARTLLRNEAIDLKTPKKVLSALNQNLKREFQDNRFLTLCYGLLDYEKSTITYASAGHEPLVLIRGKTRQIEFLKPSGFPFSQLHADLFDDRLEEKTYQLESGDLLFFYTDGWTDVIDENDDMYGEERLYSLVQSLASYSANEVIQKAYRRIVMFQGDNDQTDDITAIVLKKL